MTYYWEDIRKTPPEPDHAKYWRSNREVYERYFGTELYNQMIKEERFEEMQEFMDEILLRSE